MKKLSRSHTVCCCCWCFYPNFFLFYLFQHPLLNMYSPLFRRLPDADRTLPLVTTTRTPTRVIVSVQNNMGNAGSSLLSGKFTLWRQPGKIHIRLTQLLYKHNNDVHCASIVLLCVCIHVFDFTSPYTRVPTCACMCVLFSWHWPSDWIFCG